MKQLGKHLLIELYDCDVNVLKSAQVVEEHMREAALAANATIVRSTFHTFSPYGVSGVVVISESHLAIHTWPEHAYAAVDLFTCGESVDPHAAFEYLKAAFHAGNASKIELKRGIISAKPRRKSIPCVQSVDR